MKTERFIIIIITLLVLTLNVSSCSLNVNLFENTGAANDGVIHEGDNIGIQACLVTCPDSSDIQVIIEVRDPEGYTHRVYKSTNGAGCTGSASYLEEFDNSPNTDNIGIYSITVRAPFYDLEDTFSFFVEVNCNEFSPDSDVGAFVTISHLQRTKIGRDDYVACCNPSQPIYELCCRKILFNYDCSVASCNPGCAFLRTETDINDTRLSEIMEAGNIVLCSYKRLTGNYDVKYVDNGTFEVIGESINIFTYGKRVHLIDLRNCTIANKTQCGPSVKRVVFHVPTYRNYIQSRIVHHDPFCEGLYSPELIPEGPYELYTPRYSDVYGRRTTDFFYCYHAPDHNPKVPLIVRNTKWCDRMNMRWYSVHPLDGLNVNYDYIRDADKWNTLSGTIVLGHACPWCGTEERQVYICGNLSHIIIKRPNNGSVFEVMDWINFSGDIWGKLNVDTTCTPTCEWDFDDGFKSFSCDTQHQYRTVGNYTVTLKISYPYPGDTLSTSIKVEIVHPGEKSASILEPIDINDVEYAYYAKNGVLFVGHGTGPGSAYDYIYNWRFGDATSSTGKTVIHSYANTGTYFVCINVWNSSGALMGTDCIYVEVVEDMPLLLNTTAWLCTGKEIEKDTCLDFNIYNPFYYPLNDVDILVEVNNISASGYSPDPMCLPRERNCCLDRDNRSIHIVRIDPQTAGKFYFNNFCHGVGEEGGSFEVTINSSVDNWKYCINCNPDPDGPLCEGRGTCSVSPGPC